MKPIVFFDIEATSADTNTAKILSIAAQKLDPTDYSPIGPLKDVLLNPGIPIPKESTDIHGITDDMVKDKPKFAEIAKSLYEYLQDCNLGGFNIVGYDVPLLSEEFARTNRDWPINGTLCLDAYKIFAEKEKRDLTGAVKFYLGQEMEGAHIAANDIRYTIDVFQKQMFQYEDIGAMSEKEIHEFCVGKNALDFAGKIALNENGIPVYTFGPDKDKSVTKFPAIANWMLDKPFASNTKKVIRELLSKSSKYHGSNDSENK